MRVTALKSRSKSTFDNGLFNVGSFSHALFKNWRMDEGGAGGGGIKAVQFPGPVA